jgi:uncharacterized protein
MKYNCPLCRAKTPTSDEEAVKYLRPWVKKKKAWAQASMAQMYMEGEGVKQSHEIARYLYEQAAHQGDVGAMYDLGVMYENGQGVEQSYEKAFEYYEQAAHLGYATNGAGVEQNMAAAKDWAEKSAAQGNESAIAILQNLKN